MQNVVVHSKTPQRLRCKSCKKTWALRKNTAAYGLQSPEEKVQEVLRLLSLGVSIRLVAQRNDLSPSTIQRWKSKFIHNS